MIPDILAADRALPYLLGAFLIGYVVGATPFGLMIAHAMRLGDIRRIGSGNIGATNVLRTGHRGAAVLTLALDIAKGYAPAAIGFWLYGPLVGAAAGLGAFVGHCFSFYLSFWGGKGVATGFGVILALRWEVALLAALGWVLAVVLTRRSSAGALAAAAVSVIGFPLFETWDVWPTILVMGSMLLFRHRANLARLARGTEPPISWAPKRRRRPSDPATGDPSAPPREDKDARPRQATGPS